jgi:phosphatidylserine/phosphatidylglycerophosphate/cardiolipin synthase-like enzyme
MPDRDVYSRHVERGWQTSARFAYSSQDDDMIMLKLMNALGAEVRRGGCPGLEEIARVAIDALRTRDLVQDKGSKRRLDHIIRRHLNERTTIAAESARRIVAVPALSCIGAATFIDDKEVRLGIAKEFLADLAVHKIASPRLLRSLQAEENMSVSEYMWRQKRVQRLLISHPALDTLAHRLLAAPEGHLITIPRVSVPKLSPEEMATFPLTHQ